MNLLEDSERLQKILKYFKDLLKGSERFRNILKYSEDLSKDSQAEKAEAEILSLHVGKQRPRAP